MVNPAIKSLESKLEDEKRELVAKENALREAQIKKTTLASEIKSHEDAIHMKENEVKKLEQEMELEKKQLQKVGETDRGLEGIVHTLKQREQQDHMMLERLVRKQADDMKKAEQENKNHPYTLN